MEPVFRARLEDYVTGAWLRVQQLKEHWSMIWSSRLTAARIHALTPPPTPWAGGGRRCGWSGVGGGWWGGGGGGGTATRRTKVCAAHRDIAVSEKVQPFVWRILTPHPPTQRGRREEGGDGREEGGG